MKKESLNIVVNIAMIILFAMPCVLICSDSFFLMFLGIVYTEEYWKNIIKPFYDRYCELMNSQGA
jgi:hypothetical protein